MVISPPADMKLRLRDARRAKLLTQKELAEKAGVSKFMIVRLEKGGEPSLATVRRLADALEMKPADLIISD